LSEPSWVRGLRFAALPAARLSRAPGGPSIAALSNSAAPQRATAMPYSAVSLMLIQWIVEGSASVM